MAITKFSFVGFFTFLLFFVILYTGCQQQEERTYTDAQLKAINDNYLHYGMVEAWT